MLKINKIEYDVSTSAMITGLSEFIVECVILTAQNVTHVKCKEIRKRKLIVSEYIDALAFKYDCKKQYELYTS